MTTTSAAFELFATCARGLEPLLVEELRALGATEAAERGGGAACRGDLAFAYRACLWSRLASRVLLPLSRFELPDAEALYRAAHGIDWPGWFSPERRFAVETAGRSPAVPHTHFAALKVKDAIVDRFRDALGRRPDVDAQRPEIVVHLHLDGTHADLSLDLAGSSLHRRGWRANGGEAPLKETLASAILLRAGWPEIAAAGGALLDPMCGSGTLPIEAALIAADIAPGLARQYYAFECLRNHDAALWRELKTQAERRRREGLARLPPIAGRDVSAEAIARARRNAQAAGLAGAIDWAQADLSAARPVGASPGLVVVNPPYGERLGNEPELIKLYSLLGSTLKRHFGGWRAALFTGRPDLAPRLGLRAAKIHSFYNGELPCKLLRFEIPAREPAAAGVDNAPDFANRLRKNLRHLGRWAQRSGVSCYRLYDADLPDYALAVDLYRTDDGVHAHVQEYAAPETVDPVRAERRLRQALAAIQEVLQLPAGAIHFKIRAPQKRGAQYGRLGDAGKFRIVEEHGCRLQVNLDDYLDTGLFLDHRPLRRRIQCEAAGKRFLNLFCYTGAATAHAVKGGAAASVSVDLSANYLEWARRNLELNGARAELRARRERAGARSRARHVLIQADALAWLREPLAANAPAPYDLILCDPPTFSASKRMSGTFDVQRDHVELICAAAALLAPDGVLYFSCNRRRFKLETAALAGLEIRDLTAQTLDEDFKRPPPPHRCWAIRLAAHPAP
ncbi:MAG: bifunctional 23S rRNA (guanine(2069)-N(7))-methyltransferase RlmK/23S rRNA (guanine(2445)-N(2))-methyltransferase RlmL [Sinobacteraceae bacterium]|nr:bifunctional 23S rRNA (guanine(2069)-N(7))-methyltransferase RlmK/23S rRNA (guanine(2445)-N(2))-methyltransferase RlmL [Nevskiaceae bacterium]